MYKFLKVVFDVLLALIALVCVSVVALYADFVVYGRT